MPFIQKVDKFFALAWCFRKKLDTDTNDGHEESAAEKEGGEVKCSSALPSNSEEDKLPQESGSNVTEVSIEIIRPQY